MHRVILDTHTFLWVLSDSPELSQTVREIVSDSRVDKILSLASVWEMAIKRGLGKLVLPTSLETLIGKARSAGLILAPLELAHVLGVEALPSYHRDPFDRILISQSLAEGTPLVSRDRAFDAYGVRRIW